MTITEIDATLARLTETVERVGNNLVDLELDSTRELLDELPLEGESASSWQRTRVSVAGLWQLHGLLLKHLERARELRGTKAHPKPDQLAMLEQLLTGPSIEVSTRQVPLAERDLTGEEEVVVRCTFDDLLARMSSEFDEAKAVLARFSAAWDTLSRRARAAQDHVAELRELASSLGEPEPAELERVRSELAVMQSVLARDPFSVEVAELDRIEATLRTGRADLDAVDRLRRDVARRLKEAQELLLEAGEWLGAASEARTRALSRIAGLVVPELPADGPHLARELADVEELLHAGSWRPAAEALAAWTRRAVRLRDEGKAIAAESLAPLEERNELRGRLDGYEAKAAKLDLLEQPELAQLHGRLREELYTAPTDLRRARILMRDFQQTFVQLRRTPEVLA
jgi:hypothetical protein